MRTAAAGDGNNGALDRIVRLDGSRGIAIAALQRLDRRVVLPTDIAALDPQVAVAVDADEHAGASDLGRIIDDGPLECRERGLDLIEPLIDLLRQLVGARVLPLSRSCSAVR